MHNPRGKRPSLNALQCGVFIFMSLTALSGCVSAVSTDMRADARIAPADNSIDVAEGSDEGDVQAGTANGATGDAHASAASDTAAPQNGEDTPTDMAGIVMQPTGLNAGQASIYSNGGNGMAVPAYATQQSSGTNAALSSIYAGGSAAQASESGRLPLEDMPVPDLSAQQPLPTVGEEQGALPAEIPVPTTTRNALVEENAGANAADIALAREADDTAARVAVPEEASPAAERKKLTLASLFGSERQGSATISDESPEERPRRVINRDSAAATRQASLGINALPGVTVRNTAISDDHSEAEEAVENDDTPRFKEVASLAGLARLAPNGLWLQTEKVKTGCFKPELLNVLKTVEKHYGKPIIVTSGQRDIRRGRAKQSLHTRCEAADIQIAGVEKWELAEYLRSMPGRGGVGTYCHTESVHIDVGPERDWNWRCKRRK